MMDYDSKLRLQAYLDGELSEAQARLTRSWIEEDPQATALLAELESTVGLLAGCENEVLLPESREFFWSKVERAICASDQAKVRPSRFSLLAGWRFLVPASSIAALTLMGLLAVWGPGNTPANESTVGDPGALTYRDYAAGATLVWLSYPAESELADEEPADMND